MTGRDFNLEELANTSEKTLSLMLSFIRPANTTQTQKLLETTFLSESILGRDCLLPFEKET